MACMFFSYFQSSTYNKYTCLNLGVHYTLRSPGQSLDEEMQDILYDDIYPYLVVSAMLIVIASIEWSEQIFNKPPTPWLWTSIALITIGYCAIRLLDAWKRLKNIKLGRDGERIVGQGLEKLREKGYRVFHDVIDAERGFNIDHIVVGPVGVFTVETKTVSKKGGVQKIERVGDNVRIDGFFPDRNPLEQAKSQAYWLEDFILELTGIKTKVKPVVIYPGWFVESQQRGTDVWVLNEKAFPTFLQNEEVILDKEKIDYISAQITKYNQGNNFI